MRVLHICSGNLYGGVETTLVTLARMRDRFPRIEFDYTLCFEGRLSDELQAASARVTNLGETRLRNPFSVWRSRSNLRQLLSKESYDAAICHSSWSHAIFGPVVRAGHVPLFYWLHGAPSGRHWLEQIAARTLPDKVICCSKFTASLAWQLFPDAPKDVVYPPLVLDSHKPTEAARLAIRAELNTAADSVVVVQVSRMERGKGQPCLIKALSQLRDLPNWVCWFVGGPQRSAEAAYMRELQALASECGIASRIRFSGQRVDVPLLLHAADLFCQPNTKPEGFGQVFVEAFMSGLPVVTTAIGGGAEVIDSSCGILTPPNDIEALSSALRRLVTDSNLRARLGEAAPARARALCEPSRQLARLTDVIETTLAHRDTVTA